MIGPLPRPPHPPPYPLPIGYLRQCTLMNQVLTMCIQLRNDLQLPNHKYMAHQIALLYVRVRTLVGGRSIYRLPSCSR